MFVSKSLMILDTEGKKMITTAFIERHGVRRCGGAPRQFVQFSRPLTANRQMNASVDGVFSIFWKWNTPH